MATKAKYHSGFAKKKFKVKEYNRCPLCGRARSYMRRFSMCRLCFRKHALAGRYPVCVNPAGNKVKLQENVE